MALIYLSHPIGDGGTLSEAEKHVNKQKAFRFVSRLREMFPNIKFFCPAEAEIFVSKTLDNHFLNLDQILFIDCAIIKECEGVIVYAPTGKTTRGMDVEIEFANKHKIPILNLWYGDDLREEKLFSMVRDFIMECIDG